MCNTHCVFLRCQIVTEWAIDGNYILIKALQDKSKLGQPSKWPKMLWCLIAEFDSHQIIFSFFSSCESNLGQSASPCQVRKTPAPALPLRVDVSHYELPLPAHDQLRVVLEVVHLRGEEGVESSGLKKVMVAIVRLGVDINGPIGGAGSTTGNG